MKRLLLGFTLALAGATALHAQDVKSTTTIKADDAKSVVYSGCLQSGSEARSYVLEDAIPVADAKTNVDKHGVATTTSSYVLLPGERVDFQPNVGQRVEVTAVLIPAGHGNSTVKTETKTEVHGAPDRKTETKEKVAQTDAPQLRVMSIKHLADRCS